MTQNKGAHQLSLDLDEVYEAFSLITKGNIATARSKLGLKIDTVEDGEFVQAMVSLKKGFDLLKDAQHIEASESLQKALPIINKSNNDAVKMSINTLANISEGMARLFKGDASGAYEFLKSSKDVMEVMAHFMPTSQHEITALGAQELCYMALAREHINSGDLSAAESMIGKAKALQDKILKLLNPEKVEDLPVIISVYSSRLEDVILFARYDLEVLDLDNMERRLNTASEDIIENGQLLDKWDKLDKRELRIALQPIEKARSVLRIYYILKDLHSLSKDIIFKHSSINKEKIMKFQHIAQGLFDVEKTAKEIGSKSWMLAISRLKRIHQNLLEAGKIRKEDFGRYSGIISLVCFSVLILLFNLTMEPSEFVTPAYLLLAILSLIAGFGFGALRFKPLLKLYSKATKTEEES